MLRITLIAILCLAFIIPQSMTASIYGVIKGEVTDADGNPAIGATVLIVGTTQGANVKVNGKFVIPGVRAGKYQLKVSSVGYDAVLKSVNVNADQTTEVDFKLTTGVITTDEIVVIDDKMVEKTQVGAITTFDESSLQRTASGGVASIVTLSSGVADSENGYNIRGGRANDTQVLVDGLDVGNQFTGGFGGAGTAYAPMVSSYATEEIQVRKGGSGAQTGNSMAGQVNTVIKTGTADKFEGFIAYRSDLPSLNGSQGEGVQLIKNGNNYDLVEGGEGRKLMGDNMTNVEFGVGGPIPGLNDALKLATFYLTGRYEFRQFRDSRYENYAPVIFDKNGDKLMGGENLGQMDNQRSWVKNITGRMKFGLTDDVSIIVGGQLGQTSLENQNINTYFMNDEGIINGQSNGVAEKFAKINVTNSDVNNVFVKLTQSFTDASAFYDFRISSNINNDFTGRRANPGADPSFFGGFDMLIPKDEFIIDPKTNAYIPGQDRIADHYRSFTTSRRPNDAYSVADSQVYSIRNPLSGYIETNQVLTFNNPYGTDQIFYGHGSYGFAFREGSYLQADGSFTKYIQGDKFEHNIQTGFELRTYTMGYHSNTDPTTSSQTDIYSSNFGGNIYAEDPEVRDITSNEFHPFRGSVYVQDQISFEGIIITPGLRLDMFNSNTVYRTQLFPLALRTDNDAFEDATAKFMISPRLNASYPITDQSVFKMNFGIYYQMPELQYMYDGTNLVSRNGSGFRIGNPNIEPQRTNQYQVAYSTALTDDFALDVSAYYNDIYNQLGYAYVADADTPYFLAEVGQYGTNKGIEIDLRRRVVDNFGFRLAYTLGAVNGTSNSATSSTQFSRDPITNLPALPLSTFRLDRDITHRANVNVNFQWGAEEGPAIGGVNFLENAYVTFTGTFSSGRPYTLTEISGIGQLSELNGLEGPSTWKIDSRIGKEFKLSDIFGEGMGNSSFELYVDIFNLTNRTAAQNVYSGTQSSLSDGTLELRTIGAFTPNPYYESANPAIPGSYASNQYNQFGERVYFTSGDLDQNGIITRDEQYETFVTALTDVQYKNKPLFQLPRTIFFGAVIRF